MRTGSSSNLNFATEDPDSKLALLLHMTVTSHECYRGDVTGAGGGVGGGEAAGAMMMKKIVA